MKTFQQILNKYRKYSFSERDKGSRFERLMQAYLKTDPKYAHKFKKVWMWDEFPCKLDLGGGDMGIDLVALTHEGDYWAIQCKCFQEDSHINKAAIDGFLATSGRGFKDEDLRTTHFAHRLWISTTTLSMISVGTVRGVLHAKTENTDFNKFIIPTLNLTEILKDDLVFDLNNPET